MKKYAGILSIVILLIGISPLGIGLWISAMTDYFLVFFLPCIVMAVVLAWWAETGKWKSLAFMLAGMMSCMTVGTFLLATFFL